MAQEEIPLRYLDEFRTWVSFRHYHSFKVRGQEGLVYHPHQVKEFMLSHDIDYVEVIEDEGDLESKLEGIN